NVNGQIEADRVTVNGADVWTSSNDGSGSGLSADNLDGFNSSQFIRSDANQNVTANTEWQDNNEIRLGASADMRMVHNGSDSYITNYTGSFFVQNAANGGELVFRGRDSSGTIQEAIRVITGTDEVAAVLSQNGNNKLRTRSYGAEVFGRLEADQITVNGSNVWTAANDGSGSGLSADNLDGINSSQFLRVDQDDNIAANTEWQDNYSARFGNSADLRILHTGSTSHISNYTGELITENRAHGGDMVFRSENTGGTLREAMRVVADGNVFVRLAYDSSERLKTTSYGVEVTGRVEADQLTVNGSNVWTAANDGSGSGLDADKFDGLNSTQFLRTDTNDVVNGHTEWQDNYSVRLGSSADMRMYHNGSHSYIDNYTNNLYLRNIKESAGILMEATAGNGNRYRGIAIHTDSNNVWGRLYSNGNARVDATRDGATIYGDVTVTGGDIYLAGKRLQNNSGNLYWDGKQVATLNGGGWSSSENRVAYTGTDGVMEVGRIVDFHATANSSRDYDMRFWASADELVLWGGDMTVRDGGMNISGDYKVNGRKIDKAYIGLDRVMNFSITNSYTGNSSSLYASQQAVTQAYN
ncbi:phage tail protein, partial [Pseudomonas sp. HMWF031]